MIDPCRVCPRACGVHRAAGEMGPCQTGALARVASAGAHFGEESVLVGPGGSGTIFFAGCNLGCVFCQNSHISQVPEGVEVGTERLARIMLDLQDCSCSNVNLVTPTHVAPQALEAIQLARSEGLTLPIVYNCAGYESVEMLQALEGAIDVYMPDFKYASVEAGRKYSNVPDYPAVAQAALAEMYRQVGPPVLDVRQLMTRGVLVRHLVLPMDLAHSEEVVDLVAENAPGCAINVMGQYRPSYRAAEFPELLLVPRAEEVCRLRRYAASKGLLRVDGS